MQPLYDLTTLLQQQALKIVTAESCTGGGLSYLLTSIPGSSVWFERGFVTYSNEAKIENLGVQPNTLQTFGAVSEETVREMAVGALKRSHASLSLAITGIAGPEGGTPDKPIGTIWLGCARAASAVHTKKLALHGTRDAIRTQTIQESIKFLKELLFE